MIKKTILALSLLIIIGVSIWIQVVIPDMRGSFYDALMHKDPHYYSFFMVFMGALLTYYVIDSFRPLIVGLVGLETRLWIMEKVTGKPVCMQENTCGRISCDVKNFVESVFTVVLDVTIAFFATLGLIGQVHPALFWYAVGYTVLVTLLALIFNKPLTSTQYAIQASEQTFRTDIRTLLENNGQEKINALYNYVYSTTVKCLGVMTAFKTFASIKMLFGVAIPFFVLIPLYMQGTIDFKVLIGGVTTFDLLVSNTTVLVNLYPYITSSMASWKRIKELSS